MFPLEFMKSWKILYVLIVLGVSAKSGLAQGQNDIQQLKLQLQQLQENFERIQLQQRQQIEGLTEQIEDLQKKAASDAEQKKLEQELAEELSETSESLIPVPASFGNWTPSQPIPLLRAGSAYMNISLGLLTVAGWSTESEVAEKLNLGDHDPIQRGFSLRNAELAFDGAVDPFFKGFANTAFKLSEDNETEFELEEAYLVSSSLPSNLQIKAGQFFAAFGRQNPMHPHQWNFVDQPLILNRVFGPEGLRNVGAQLSWLAPTPFYTELFLGVLNGAGGTAFSFRNPGEEDADPPRLYGRETLDRGLRGPGDLLFTPRIASSFDLTETQTIVLGTSGAFGPNNTGPNSRTEIYGLDAYWKWSPLDAMQGFPFVSWQTEALYRRFGAGEDLAAGLASENIRDWGLYSEVMWGVRPRWVTGLRGEFVTGNNSSIDSESLIRGDRTKMSPNLTWYPSEFSKLRLQYNYDKGQNIGSEHSVWLQLEVLLGAHAAHQF